MTWRRASSETLFRHPIFDLERRTLKRAGARSGEEREALVLTAPDWVNVVALTGDQRVLLVRQWRYGVEEPTLEIPGGMVDEGEEPRRAAARELEEETGHRARRLELLGHLHPNPAFLANRVSTWLATGLERVHHGPPGVGDEEIELESAPLADVPALITAGRISHALVVAGFYLLWARGGGPAGP